MVRLSSQYARRAFETSTDVAALCKQLGETLTQRLLEAASTTGEIKNALEELRQLGHQLYLWDTDDDAFEVWGGNYHDPENTRIILQFYYDVDSPPSVGVTFGPWPEERRLPTCQRCGQEMTPTTLSLSGIGHGSINAPPVELKLMLGEAAPITASCGHRSLSIDVPASWCASCGSMWIRDVCKVRRT